MLRTKGVGVISVLGLGFGLTLGLEGRLEDAVRCKENALAKTENGLKNAFGSSTAYDVAGNFIDSRRASESRCFPFFRYFVLLLVRTHE